MSWRDRCDDASPHDLIRQLAVAPLADRSVGVSRLLTSHRDDLAHLLRRELRRRATAWCIRQPFGHTDFLERHVLKLEPALPPETWSLVIQSQPSPDLRVVLAITSGKDDPCARHQLLSSSVSAYQALQIRSLMISQHNLGGSR
jgi:hypothetical protein